MRVREVVPIAPLLVAVLVLLTAVLTGGPAAAGDGTPGCADRWTTPVAKAVSDGRHRPVVFVHGWNGGSGSMQPVADALTAAGSPVAGAVQTDFFDYREHATEWANSSAIGRCLASYLHAVSDAYRAVGGDGKVEVVAHSMGGLAARFAAATTEGGVLIGTRLAGLVTIDTPHLGSPFGGPTLGYGGIARVLEYFNRHELFFPGPGTDAGVCLGLHTPPQNVIGDGKCATPPYLPAPARVFELGGDASVSRSIFGIHLYDVDTGADGIVPATSSYGYLRSAQGDAPLGGRTGHTVVTCSTSLGDAVGSGWFKDLAKATDQSVGELASMVLGTDQSAFNALQPGGRMDAPLATFMGAVEKTATCSHSGMLHDRTAQQAVAQAVHDDDAAARQAAPPCTADALRKARDSHGDQPLDAQEPTGSGYVYDVVNVQGCAAGYALAQFNLSGSSCFSYFLFVADGNSWKTVSLPSCIRIDSPDSQPVFARADVVAAGLNPDAVQRALQKYVRRPLIGESNTPDTTGAPPVSPTVLAFETPSHNIGCEIAVFGDGTDEARCDIAQATWAPPPRPASCHLGWGMALQVTAAGAGFECVGDTANNDHEVPYGSVETAGVFRCDVESSGVKCTNTTTGHGFTLAKSAYRLF